ncbi:DUF559 domain-containing protein [Arthrobacter sp. H5]|uniref:endonuclease domain-containing protein n=1 Tax=Arthrobacter sp. H5 TaxID=1267973 RepID=UPI0004842E00|nr:DUF559 domain-containing protein [Arthrobacter sp. H5]
MKSPHSLSPDLPHTVFTVDDAVKAQIPYSRLRRKDIEAPTRGVRSFRGHRATLLERVSPITRLDRSTSASHFTAARLVGILLPYDEQPDEPLHLTRHSLAAGQPRRPGVQGHRAGLQPEDVLTIGGVSITAPAWTWTDLAETLTLDALIIAGDSLLRRPDAPGRRAELILDDPLSSIDQLTAVVARRRGSRGVRKARVALPFLRSGVDSAPETKLRLEIMRAGLPEPLVNQWIYDAHGHRISRPDLQYPESKIALEYEGEHHLLDPEQWARDIERDERLRALGWIILRFTKKHLQPSELHNTMKRIRKALARSSSVQE